MTRDMPRRYLSSVEAHAALRRGKAIVFLGGCLRSDCHGIRWVQIRGLPNG
jgi:coenzyme F420-reducing hydrogenase delta subunit